MKINISIVLYFICLYVFITLTLFFASPFLVDFGAKRNIILITLSFMQRTPVNPVLKNDVSIGNVLINSLVWTILISLLILLLSKLINWASLQMRKLD